MAKIIRTSYSNRPSQYEQTNLSTDDRYKTRMISIDVQTD